MYDELGFCVRQFGHSYFWKQCLKHPHGLAVDRGNVFVCDYDNNRVQVYTRNGKFVTSFGLSQFTRPAGIAIDIAGRIYVSDERHVRMFVFPDVE